MTRTPRWRILLPAAIVATLLAPAARALPGGLWLPDVWLLLAFGAIPVPAPFSWRRAVAFVLVLAVFRSSVSSVPFIASLAGLGGAVVARDLLHRALKADWPARLLVGAAAAALPAWLDARAASRLGAPLDASANLARVLGAGLFWMLWPQVQRLGRARRA